MANHLADDLSRNDSISFLLKVPWANRQPTPLPPALLALLLDQKQDWTSSLAPAVQRYFQGGLAPSTQRSYTSAMKKSNTFRIKYNVGDPFPVSEQLLHSYATYLADGGLAPQTIKSYLAAIRDMQISIRLPDTRDQSSLPILKRVQAGINRACESDNQPREVRLPITPHLLRQIRAALDSSRNPEKVTLWAMCCTAFFGSFQLGKLLLVTAVTFKQGQHLAWGDVAVDNPQDPGMICIYLKQSRPIK